jgi:hypothetical protein
MKRQTGRLQQVELPLWPTPTTRVSESKTTKLPPRSESELRAALADLLRRATGFGPRDDVDEGGEDDPREDHR